MKKLSKFFICATLLLFALGIVACDEAKSKGVKVSAEEWNAAFEKLANKGVAPTTQGVLNSLKDGDEGGEENAKDSESGQATYESLTMTDGGVIIQAERNIKNKDGENEIIKTTIEACPDWELQYTQDLLNKFVEISFNEDTTNSIGYLGFSLTAKKPNNQQCFIEIDADDAQTLANAANVTEKKITKNWTDGGHEDFTIYDELEVALAKLKNYGNDNLDGLYESGSYKIGFNNVDGEYIVEGEEGYSAENASELTVTFDSNKDVKKLKITSKDTELNYDLNISYAEAGTKSTYKCLPIPTN